MSSVRLNENLIKSLGSVILMSSAEMIAKTGIPCTTWYNIMKKPAVITIQQLLAISNGLQIPVSRFFSTDKADVIGKRDDYVTEPYIPCRYDDAAMREMVSKKPDASWQKAADLAGMSRTRMRNSLLAVTRTPVVRFLDVCKAFDIDPFTVLTDPNGKVKRKAAPTLSICIEELRQQIADINATVSELRGIYEKQAERYDSLLEAHKRLLERFNEHLDESQPVMAAEGR